MQAGLSPVSLIRSAIASIAANASSTVRCALTCVASRALSAP